MNRFKIQTVINGLNKTLLLLIAVVFVSCNDEFKNQLKKEYPDDLAGQVSKNSKVLFVIVDGLRGNAIQNLPVAKIPGLTQMTKNSVYSWAALTDYKTTKLSKENGWANLMTGVTDDKHGVGISGFSGNHLDQYPSIITRIGEGSGFNTAVFSTSTDFLTNFAEKAQVKVNSANDLTAKNIAVDAIKNGDEKLVVVQMSGLDEIGRLNNYDWNTTAYANGVTQMDTYINELKVAVESRVNYKNENWLIVVSSGKGGVENSVSLPTVYDDQSRNTFSLFYNAKFSSKIIAKPIDGIPYIDYGIRFKGALAKGKLADPSKYNFGVKPNKTVQLLFKQPAGSYGYATILGKKLENLGGGGWNIFCVGNGFELRAANMTTAFIAGGVVSDGNWHTITVVFDGVNLQVKTYVDGAKKATGIMTATNIDNIYPLNIGQLITNTNGGTNALITNVQIFDMAFSDMDVSNYSCRTVIDNTHPYFNKLIGYWKGNQNGKNIIKEELGTGNDFLLEGPYSWDSFNDVSPNLCPPVSPAFYRLVPNGVDVPFQILSWLGIQVPQIWGLDGKTWTASYTTIKP